MTRQVSGEFQVPVAWSIGGTPFTVTEPVAHDLLMVAREAVYNSMLHGHPARVGVALQYRSSELVLDLDDDGCGFDPAQAQGENGHHFGLKGMQERVERSGGKFRLATAPGKGVQIEVRVPRTCAQLRRIPVGQPKPAESDLGARHECGRSLDRSSL